MTLEIYCHVAFAKKNQTFRALSKLLKKFLGFFFENVLKFTKNFQAKNAEREDDGEAILSEHIDRTLKSGHHSPKTRSMQILGEVVHSHTASVKSSKPDYPSSQLTQQNDPCYGSLPAFGGLDTNSKVFILHFLTESSSILAQKWPFQPRSHFCIKNKAILDRKIPKNLGLEFKIELFFCLKKSKI